MAMTPSQLSIIVKSQGVSDAAVELDKLAKAAASVDAETKSFVIAQAKLQDSQKKTTESTKQTSQALIEQKRDYVTWQMAGQSAMKQANEALRTYNQSTKEYTNLWKQMDTQKLLEQTQQYKLYKLSVEAANKALKEAEKIEKAHGDALEMNKKFDAARVKSLEKTTETVKMNARGVTEQEFAMIKAHEQALKMNKAFDAKADRLKNLNNHGTIWNNTLKSMATAALAYMGVNFAIGVIKEADAWAMMQSKLQLATGSMQSAKAVQKDLFDLSQRLRVPLEDSAKLYTRMSHPLTMMGRDAKQTMGMVESLGLALKLSGATGQEASSAMLQFSQSMNAGRLNGGEFNSIAEASPNILRAIETELRRTGQWGEHTTETLKKMGSEGKITGELLYRSLTNALPQFRRDFEVLPLTFDGAMERIKNAWLKAVGEMGENNKFTQEFAKSMRSLEENLPAIANTIGGAFNFIAQNLNGLIAGITTLVGLGLSAWLVETVISIGKLVSALKLAAAASLVFAASPLGIVVAALAAAFGLFAGGVWAGYNAMEALAGSSSTVEAANSKMLNSSEMLTKKLEDENAALTRQFNLLQQVKDIKEDSIDINASEGRSRMATLQATIDSLKWNKSKFDEKGKTALAGNAQQMIADLEAELKGVEKLVVANETLAKKIKDKVDGKKAETYWATISEKYDLDRAARMKAEIDGLDKLLLGTERYNQAKAAIEKRYSKSAATREVNPELTNLDKVNKLLVEQVELNKEWEQSANKKLTVGEKFRIQVEAENVAIEKTLASGMLHNKVLTEAEKRQARKTIEVNKEAIAVAKIVEAQQKYREMEQADNARIEKAEKTLEAEEQNLAILTRQLEVGEETKIARAQQSVVEAEIALSLIAQNNGMNEEFATAQKTFKVRQDTLAAIKGIEDKDNADAQAKKYEDSFQAANKKISDGLYNAIGKGSDSAIKKLTQDLKSWAARLVLSPIIDPISKFGAGIMSPNAASAQGSAGNIMELGSTIYKSITTGFEAASTAAGSAFTSFATSAFGEAIGLSSSTAAMSAELAALTGSTIGAGTTAGLTTAGSFGASAASMMPYVAAAVAAFQGVKAINGDYRLGGLSADAGALLGIAPRLFGMKEKEFAAQTVTGNLGTNDLTRNQAWTQSGGLFRSDRADTWKYRLSDSIATTGDGKSYQDTASMESDKALLNQLNTMYDAVKIASTEYAKALGINADSIKARTDAINFTFGKTAEETSANITKAFEDVTNLIARDLLGDLAQLSKVGETSAQTMGRLATNVSATNGMFKALGYDLFQLNVSGIKAADGLVTLFGGLDKFQSIAADYYDKFYSESEKTQVKVNAMTKSLQDLGIELPTSRAAFRGLVEAAQKAGNNELYVSLMKLSSAFAEITAESVQAAEKVTELPQAVRDTFDALSKDAERWLSLRNQATSLKDSIDEAMGGKKDPTTRIKQLWDALSADISPEQKLQLAGELKDLTLSKYQVEKESMQKLIDFGRQLRGYVDSLKVGSLSPLTMTEKLAEAQRQYQTTLAKAQGGDTNAQSMLQSKADTYLQLAQTAFASSSGYQAVFGDVTTSLDSLGIEAMSAGEQANTIANNQLAELQRLRDFAAQTETTATNYYRDSLQALTNQINVMDKMYGTLGLVNGTMGNLATLSAESAAAIRGQVGATGNQDFVNSLYNSYAGKFGTQIDLEGFNYWMQEVATFGRDYTTKAFRDSVAVRNSAPIPVANEVASLKSDIAALVTEIQGLREDATNQTGALMEVTMLASNTNAETVSKAITNKDESTSWKEKLSPELT